MHKYSLLFYILLLFNLSQLFGQAKVPSEESLNKVVLDAAVVKGESEPLMVYEKASKTKTG